jgi:DNA polymerase-1
VDRLPFKQVWVLDTEFRREPGGLPDPVCCLVAHELRSGHVIRQWTAAGGPMPYGVGPSALFIAHYSIAEWVSHLALGWPLPVNVVDTFAETRALRNGLPDGKSGLLAAASRYGIATISTAAKDAGRQLAMRGGPWTEEERVSLIAYCETDVTTNAELFRRMLPEILAPKFGLQHALLRGRYMTAVARMEFCGIPVDSELLARLQSHWPELRWRLVAAVDPGRFDCYEGTTFKQAKFARFLERVGLLEHWPRTKTGRLSTAEKEFKHQADAHPVLTPLYELHYTLEMMKMISLGVGKDNRHRADMLAPFATNTGRNAPKAFVFAPARWIRHLIKPEPGRAVIYSDYSGQEGSSQRVLKNVR